MKRFLITIATIALAGFQASSVPSVRITPDAFRETDVALSSLSHLTRPEEPSTVINVVATGQILGVLAGSLSSTPAFPDLYISGLRPGDRLICVDLASRDGRYEARARAVLPVAATRAGQARVVLPTANNRLRGLSAGEIGPLVRVTQQTDRCPVDADVLTASWGAPAAVDQPPTILLPGAGRGTRPDIRRPSEDTAVACDPIPDTGPSLAAYRFTCSPKRAACVGLEVYQIVWAGITERSDALRLRVRRHCART